MRPGPLKFDHWRRKFGYAFRGFVTGVRGESSFLVHFACGAAALICAVAFRISTAEWCAVLLAIVAVLTAEMFNSSLERLARAITADKNPDIKAALDIGSTAVLMSAAGAVAIGLVIFAPRFLALL